MTENKEYSWKIPKYGFNIPQFCEYSRISQFSRNISEFPEMKKISTGCERTEIFSFHFYNIIPKQKNNSWNIIINSLWYFVIWAKYFKSVRGILLELHPVIFQKKSWNTNLNSWNGRFIMSEKCPFFTIFSKHSKRIIYCLQKWRSYNRN